jgi:RNA polymerase sigma-70 factor (ECF subfamily)
VRSSPTWLGNTGGPRTVGRVVDLPVTSQRERERAFQAYVVPELELLYAMAMRLTREPHAAEDLVQDTLLRAYRAIDRFDGRHPRAWLLTILRNTNINRGRKRTPALLVDPEHTLSQLAGAGADARDGAAEPALERIADPAVVRAVQALSDDHRAVVALVDVDGLTYAEAAELLDVPIGTVMSRLHRARRRLRRRLEHDGRFREVPR